MTKVLNTTRYQGRGRPRLEDYDNIPRKYTRREIYPELADADSVTVPTFYKRKVTNSTDWQLFWVVIGVTVAVLITAYGDGISRATGAL